MNPLRLHITTVAIAASYVTLFAANPHVASTLCGAYGAVMLALGVVNLVMDWRHV